MSIDAKQLKALIIVPTLLALNLHSEAVVNLLLGTCAQESHMGTYLKQINGPALGIYQTEPTTHDDIWKNYLAYKKDLADKICILSGNKPESQTLINNFVYATAIARIVYLRVPELLPAPNDIEGLAKYWKRHYNTPLGKGCVADFITNYKKYVNT
jgi:hypothetical protein